MELVSLRIAISEVAIIFIFAATTPTTSTTSPVDVPKAGDAPKAGDTIVGVPDYSISRLLGHLQPLGHLPGKSWG